MKLMFLYSPDAARDDLAPGDLGIDDGLAPAPAVVDHHDEILHAFNSARPRISGYRRATLFLKIRT